MWWGWPDFLAPKLLLPLIAMWYTNDLLSRDHHFVLHIVKWCVNRYPFLPNITCTCKVSSREKTPAENYKDVWKHYNDTGWDVWGDPSPLHCTVASHVPVPMLQERTPTVLLLCEYLLLSFLFLLSLKNLLLCQGQNRKNKRRRRRLRWPKYHY